MRLIAWPERLLALTACCTGVSIAVGAKSALHMLTVLTCVAVWRWRLRSPDAVWFRKATQEPEVLPFGLFACFVAYALASAAWAPLPGKSLEVATLLGWVVLLCWLMRWQIQKLSPSVQVLLAGWFVIGLTFGISIMAFDLALGHPLTRFALSRVPVTGGEAMIVRDGETVIAVATDLANFSVAGANIVLWPSVLLILNLGLGRAGMAWAGLLVTLAALSTWLSAHETSKLGFALSAIVLVASLWHRRLVMRSMLWFNLAAIALIVPLTIVALHGLKLHQVSAFPVSLQARIIVWSTTAERWTDAPMIGVGAWGTQPLEDARKQAGLVPTTIDGHSQPRTTLNHAHNFALQVWYELGAIGALLFGLAVAAAVSTLARLAPVCQPLANAAVVMVSVTCFGTWSLWHSWLPATIALSTILLFLAHHLVTAASHGSVVALPKVWLPNSGSRLASR